MSSGEMESAPHVQCGGVKCHQCNTRGGVGHGGLISWLLTEKRVQPMKWLLRLPGSVFMSEVSTLSYYLLLLLY